MGIVEHGVVQSTEGGGTLHFHTRRWLDAVRNGLLHPFGASLSAVAVTGTLLLTASPAAAVPSFAQQTGQPCQACHVSGFGPQLKPYGRDFKLYGYQSSDGKSKQLPIALMLQASDTHTKADQNPPPAAHFGPNDNFAVDQISAFYAGKIGGGWGAFSQATFDGIGRSFSIDNVDVRHAAEATILGRDSVIGIDFNNNPTVQDVWNSTPAWGFPYSSSGLAPSPVASTLIDGGLAHQVAGGGAYLLWDDTLYLEGSAYLPLNRQLAGRLGAGTGVTTDRYSGVLPYWRAAVLHDIGVTQTVQVGAFGIHGDRYPGGDVSAGTDTINDWAVDATYQYIGKLNVISAHAVLLHEDQDLKASSILLGTNPKDRLNTARADLTYSYNDTWTPSVQAFRTTGTNDAAQYGPGANTQGYVVELAYVPWGKPNSPLYWLNARVGLQYVAYSEFNGDRQHASDNNTLYANLWIALAPFGSLVHR